MDLVLYSGSPCVGRPHSWIWNYIGRNCLMGHRKKIAKSLMRTFTCRSTFLYVLHPRITIMPCIKNGKAPWLRPVTGYPRRGVVEQQGGENDPAHLLHTVFTSYSEGATLLLSITINQPDCYIQCSGTVTICYGSSSGFWQGTVPVHAPYLKQKKAIFKIFFWKKSCLST
jgi:hypothetical protein